VCRKPIKLSLVALLVGSGITSTTAVLVVGGQSAVAASKGVGCPDNTKGVTDGSWSVVCTGQTAAGATVTITKAKTTSMSLMVQSSNPAESVNASYNSTDATFSLTFGAVSQTISIIVTNTSGAVLNGVAAKSVATSYHPHGAVVTILGR